MGNTADEGVVGCVESVSEGACDVKGVSRLDGAGTASLGCGVSEDDKEDSTEAGSGVAEGTALGGNSTGSFGDWGAGRLRRLRGSLRGKEPSVKEYQGSYKR